MVLNDPYESNELNLSLADRYSAGVLDMGEAAAPQLWNALPPSLRDAASVETFKKNLKTFLFRKAYADRFSLNKF